MSRPPGYWITSQHILRLDWQSDLVMCPCSVRRDGVAELNQRNDDDDDDDILLQKLLIDDSVLAARPQTTISDKLATLALRYECAHLTITVSQIERDNGRKSSFFHTPLHSTSPLGGFPSDQRHPVWHGKIRMAWLPDGEKISKISLFVLAQLTNVTDRRTDTACGNSRAYAQHRAAKTNEKPKWKTFTVDEHSEHSISQQTKSLFIRLYLTSLTLDRSTRNKAYLRAIARLF